MSAKAPAKNKILEELLRLGIVEKDSVKPFYPRVRDRDDVGVLRCERSGVIFLDRTDHMERSYYTEKEGTSYWSSEDRAKGLKETAEDDNRRAKQIESLVRNKHYADVGSGMGGILDLVKPIAASVTAVEPQNDIRNTLVKLGYEALESIELLAAMQKKFDLITMFHVFEHITDPIASLKNLRSSLSEGGTIFIEVPHAGDALITSFNLDAFKKFTFWSEHLILHTKRSLETYLKAAGFKNIQVKGFQRYPLANHLLWLKEGRPGGQNIFTQFRDIELESIYSQVLDKHDLTDTIIATASK